MFAYTNIMRLTITKEDYLRALYLIEKKRGAPARAVDLARELHLSRSTVSERLQELARQKLVLHGHYGDVALTSKGRHAAQNLTRKHRLIEVFLLRTLKVAAKDVHSEAHELEHAMSDAVIEKLAKFLGNPKVDPHGAPIPPRA